MNCQKMGQNFWDRALERYSSHISDTFGLDPLAGKWTLETMIEVGKYVAERENQNRRIALEEAYRPAERAATRHPRYSQGTLDRRKLIQDKETEIAGQVCIPFHFYPRADESTTCFLLEVLWNTMLAPDKSAGGDRFTLRDLGSADILESFLALKKMLAGAGVSAAVYDQVHHPSWVFSRQWSSSFREYKLQVPSPSGAGLAIGTISPSDITFRDAPLVSIAGEWFVSLLKGTTNKKRALEIVKTDFSSVSANEEILSTGVGLPTLEAFYGGDPELAQVQQIYEGSRSRTEINHYHELRHIFYEQFRTFLEFEYSDEAQCVDSIKRLLARVANFAKMLG